jgi:benzil reductase ((S)-benzoin forming)
VLILSGPTDGLGLELLRLLTIQEYPLILVGRGLDRIQSILDSASCDIHKIDFDLAQAIFDVQANSLELAVFNALKRSRARRVLFVNNAAVITPIGQVGVVAPSTFPASLAVNLIAPAALCGAAVKYVQSVSAELFIMNISSGAALRPVPGWAAYCAAKAATRQLFEVVRAEQQSNKLRLEHIDPGVLDTKMQSEIRSVAPGQFPLLEQFQRLKSQGLLKLPAEAAKELLSQVQDYFEK